MFLASLTKHTRHPKKPPFVRVAEELAKLKKASPRKFHALIKQLKNHDYEQKRG